MLTYKRDKLALQNLKYYNKWDFEAIRALYELVIVEGWSLTYSLRLFEGQTKKFSEERKRNYFLNQLYLLIQADKKKRREQKKLLKLNVK